MGTTKEDIKGWFKSGKEEGHTHMLVVCDSFDYEDYPVYVDSKEDAEKKHAAYVKGEHSMQRVMEVYNLSKDMNKQLNQHRVFEF